MPSFEELQKSQNIVQLLDDKQLTDIAQQVVNGYSIDAKSISEWKEITDKAMEMVNQKMETKNHPWPGASNIKFPLIKQAVIDYASRTLPEIIQQEKVVKVSVVGQDRDANKYKRAQRIAELMSYQLTGPESDWEDGIDRLLQMLPVTGTVFKKTYYNLQERKVVSEVCSPDKIVVNYNSRSLESARRITHLVTLYQNDIVERQRRGIYSDDVDVETLRPASYDVMMDDDYPIELLEQHCYLDLDDDGYKEPYIVIAHKESRQILRIVNRFKDVERNKEGKILRIEAKQYFVDFHFIRSPDNGFYSLGFGSLLLPLNAAINTVINQLVDSGTLANMQGGFVGKGLRMKGGEFRFKMGEWKVLDAAAGADLQSNIFPLPTKEPSQTLFSLLSLLINIGRDLSATTDVMLGKQPAQNVASNTINQLVEQGTKVFSAINKRLYRSLKKEYRKLFELNHDHLTDREYTAIIDDETAKVKIDFNLDDADVHPVADPNVSSENQRLARATTIQQLRTIDVREADRYLLESLQLDESIISKLLPEQDPNAPPPLEAQKVMAELQEIQANIAKLSADATLAAEKVAMEKSQLEQLSQESQARVHESMARVWKMQRDALSSQQKIEIAAAKMGHQEEAKKLSIMQRIAKDNADVDLRSAELTIKAKEVDNKGNKDDKSE